MTWYDGRPIHARLPEKGYGDNAVANALTEWIDSNLTDKAEQLQSFYLQLSPDTCDDYILDYLAWLCGLAGSYWDINWTPQVKRSLIAASHSFLWSNRGTLEVMVWLLVLHGISHDIWMDGSSTLSFKLPKTLGTNRLRFFVRLPLKYQRTSLEWAEAERTLRNFAPAVVQHKVCYQGFKLGFSVLGDPLFKPVPSGFLTDPDNIDILLVDENDNELVGLL